MHKQWDISAMADRLEQGQHTLQVERKTWKIKGEMMGR
jgi:hypothetical protein